MGPIFTVNVPLQCRWVLIYIKMEFPYYSVFKMNSALFGAIWCINIIIHLYIAMYINIYIIELLQLCQCVLLCSYVDSNVGIQFGPNVFANNPRLRVM